MSDEKNVYYTPSQASRSSASLRESRYNPKRFTDDEFDGVTGSDTHASDEALAQLRSRLMGPEEAVSPVTRQLEQLDKEIEWLRGAVRNLIEQIDPVLTPEETAENVFADSTGPEEPHLQCGLADTLESFSDRVNELVHRLNKTIDRVEV